MKSSVLIRVAGDSIRKNKMRTLLTMLGIVIGVAAVIAMIALGNGAQRSIQDRIASLGTTLLTVQPGQLPRADRARRIGGLGLSRRGKQRAEGEGHANQRDPASGSRADTTAMAKAPSSSNTARVVAAKSESAVLRCSAMRWAWSTVSRRC